MNIEKKRMEAWGFPRKVVIGHITLDKLAIPETVHVTLLGEEIIPESFDCFGHPNFSEEQQLLYLYKSEEYKRKHGENAVLKAEIRYVYRQFCASRDAFDSLEGIKEAVTNLSWLNETLDNRRIFKMVHPDEELNNIMIFGCYLLDRVGNVWSIEKKDRKKVVSKGAVESYEEFRENNKDLDFRLTTGGYVIPPVNSVCPCCGKQITIADLQENPCILEEGKYYHESCFKEFDALRGIDKLTRGAMACVYKTKDYTYELLPNDWPNCEHLPMILFHTIDGDIIMSWGWRERMVSIEWKENYKPFDMQKIFREEHVKKWDEHGLRGIHAWSDEKVVEYLEAVRKEVNPNYSVFGRNK